jgi:two-component system chemotaxis response regulator CheB
LGLAAVKSNGGATIVQDPEDALYAGMPSTALAHVAPDAVVPSELIARTIVAMVTGNDPPPEAQSGRAQAQVPLGARVGAESSSGAGTTICPECGGVLTEREEAGTTLWQCRVGHRYSPEGLLDAQALDVEAALWAAIRALEDRARLFDRMANQLEPRGQRLSARSFQRKAEAARDQARIVREAVTRAASESAAQGEESAVEREGMEARQAARGGAA